MRVNARRRSRLAAVAAESWSYPQVGATRDLLPTGYRQIRQQEVIGTGEETFRLAANALDTWAVHRAAGLGVICAESATRPGVDVVLLLGDRWVHLTAACRIVYVIREPGRHGFAYGTLHSHPESGEELFAVSLEPDSTVTFTITAFSRPRSLLARVTRPLAHVAQDLVTHRYLTGMQRLVQAS